MKFNGVLIFLPATCTLLSKTYKSHVTTYDYYTSTRLIRSITDIDGRKTAFTYDKLMRLTKATKDNASVNGSGVVIDGNVKTEYTYHYKEVSDPNNWVKTKNSFTPVTGSSLTSTETFEYLDGLGRTLQSVKKAWSPTLKDVVTAVAYDNQGRVIKQYTPFMTTVGTGAFATIPGGQKYTSIAYEPSPLGRTSSVTPPDWYATTTTYGTNLGSEVGYYDGVTAASYYPANRLNKTTVTTPQSSTKNIETVSWTDKKGRVVMSLRKEAGSATVANTYTLYDNKDRVSKVLPPSVGTGAGDAGLRFEYLYDGADRLISKKVPDMAAVTMKYNNRDQLVLVQDGNLLALGKWMLNNYDDYGRPISNGLHTGSTPDPNAVLAYSEQHTSTSYGTSGIDLGKVKTALTWIPGFGTFGNRNFTYSTVTGRLLTDNGTNHLSSLTGSDNYTYTYDYAGNVLTKVRAHKTSTASSTLTLTERYTYDQAGRKNTFYHKINTNSEKQIAKYAYDFRDRLIDKSLDSVRVGSVNSYLQSIDYTYNEQNWLKAINGGSSFGALSQSAIALCGTTPPTPDPTEAAYAANPDGNDIFKLNLYYDSLGIIFGSPSPVAQRNGNISQLIWQTRGRERQGYTLHYDYLDRLTTSYYADITSGGTASTNNKFQENVTYADARGNILSINRNGNYKTTGSATCFTVGTIDNLTFTYNTGTNRLQKVADATSIAAAKAQGFNPGTASGTATYGYDANGNMNSDPYKNMTLTYNHLNLPISMNFGSAGSIGILYDQVGKKLRKTVTPGTGTGYTQDYVDGLEYRTNAGGRTLTLEAIYNAEGRITPNGANYQYEYNIQDHLGNTRLTFADLNTNGILDVPGDILQENHYYPFGMRMDYTWIDNAALDNKYQYNGKEFNDDFGLNWNDYGARWYDAAIGRFPSVDPIIEKFPYLTPFNYASNSPVSKIDLWGLQGGFVHDLKKGAESGFGSLVGALTAMAEDFTGADLPSPDNTSSFGQGFATGEMLGHLGMIGVGGLEGLAGAGMIDVGATAVVSGVLAPEGAVAVVAGTALAVHGPLVVSNAVGNLTEGTRNMSKGKDPGSYTHDFESGMKYHGKGGEKRAKQSGNEVSKTNDDPVTNTEWTPSASERDAFKDEATRLEKDGGHRNPNNYNKRASPGTNYKKQDGDIDQ